MLFVGANLEHAVRGRVNDGLARFDAFFAQFLQNDGAGRGFVAQNAGDFGAFDEFVDDFSRKAGIFGGEVTPFEHHGNAGHFPMPRCRVLAFADFFGIAVNAFDFGHGDFHVRRVFAVALFVQFAQSQFAQIRQFQWSRAPVFGFAFGAGLGDVPQRVRADIAESLGIRRFAAAE